MRNKANMRLSCIISGNIHVNARLGGRRLSIRGRPCHRAGGILMKCRGSNAAHRLALLGAGSGIRHLVLNGIRRDKLIYLLPDVAKIICASTGGRAS